MTPEEFRRHGHALIDRIADYRAGLEERPVASRSEPGAIAAALPAAPPDGPEPFEAILADLDGIVMPGLTHWQHPSFFGYFPANAELASVLGDYLSTGLGVLGLAWASSPALTELETVTTGWLRQMTGLSAAWSGVIQDTASSSTLVALISARERSTDYGLTRGGLQAGGTPLIIYASAEAHSSIEKAAGLAGFGRDHLRLIETDAEAALRPDRLEAAILADLAAGLRPCAIVATVGTTASAALDPIAAIAAIADRHGVWLHVD